MPGRLFGDGHHHHIAIGSAEVFIVGHQDVLADALVLRHHPLVAAFPVKAANKVGISAFQDFHHPAFLAPAPVLAMLAHHHTITMQHATHFFLLQEQVTRLVVWNEEAITIGMAFDVTALHLDLFRQAQRAAPVDHELSIALHGAHANHESLPLVGFQPQAPGQFIDVHRPGRLTHQLQNKFPARHSLAVFGAFALQKRILPA